MSPAERTARFEDVEEGEEFLSEDGRRYMKLPDAGPGPVPEDVEVLGLVPGHVGRKEPEVEGEERYELRGAEGRTVCRRFAPDETVIRDELPGEGVGARA